MVETVSPSVNPLYVISPDLFEPDGARLRNIGALVPIADIGQQGNGPVFANAADLAQAAHEAWYAARASRNICLATVSYDGWPHATVLGPGVITNGVEAEGIISADTRFLFSSYPGSRHSQHLAKNPRAALLVYASGLDHGAFSVERVHAQEVPFKSVPEQLAALNGLRRRWDLPDRHISEYDPSLPDTLRLYEVPFSAVVLPVRGRNSGGKHISNAAYRISSAILAAS